MRTLTPELHRTSFDPVALARAVGSLPPVVAPEVIAASAALYAPFHESEPYEGVRVQRDVSYGSHERHRLDVFAVAERTAASTAPVLVFVHGGGFVGGDKKIPGTPYFDNVALWAVRHGLVGVNITYRLAPEFPWPAGADDVAAALDWVHQHAADYGGDPRRILLMGTSAGAVHVASYVAHPEFHLRTGVGAAAAILLSGVYDISTSDGDMDTVRRLYFGDDAALYPQRSSLQGLVETDLPLLIGVAEFDPEFAAGQALQLTQTYFERHRRWPNIVRLTGHNHFTATLHLNTPDDYLGRQILRLIDEARHGAGRP